MKKRIIILITLILPLICIASDIPRIINYQGVLFDKDEKPITNEYVDIVFKIFNESDKAVWQEEHTGVHVFNGLFNVLLGMHNPIDVNFNQAHFLSIQFNEEPEMEQRMLLTSTPSSFRSLNSLTVKDINVRSGPEPHVLIPLDDEQKFPEAVLPASENEQEIILKNYPDTTSGAFSSALLTLHNTGMGPALEVNALNGKGVHALSNASNQAAIQGEHSGESAGIRGVSLKNHGVIGYSEHVDKAGVYGNNTKGIGAMGNSQSGTGVHGQSVHGHGIYGTSAAPDKAGIYGESTKAPAIRGRSEAGDGIVGRTEDENHSGISGYSTNGNGITARSESNIGMIGVTQSDHPFNAGVRGRSQGEARAVFCEGDLFVTGAIYGDAGPNQGASIPNPAYDSDWQEFPDSTYSVTLQHKLGGDASNYFVYLQYRQNGQQTHYGYGLEKSKYQYGIATYGTSYFGAFWQHLTNSTIMISQSFWVDANPANYPYYDIEYYSPSLRGEFRVLIWVYD